jgi:hypothetical protein
LYHISINAEIIIERIITNIKFTGNDREIQVLNDGSKNGKFSKKALS